MSGLLKGPTCLTGSKFVLDVNRPFGIVYGDSKRRYEQDGHFFDIRGDFVGERPILHTKWSGDPKTPKDQKPTK